MHRMGGRGRTLALGLPLACGGRTGLTVDGVAAPAQAGTTAPDPEAGATAPAPGAGTTAPSLEEPAPTCYELAMHGDDPAQPFEIMPGEAIDVWYYRAPWQEPAEA